MMSLYLEIFKGNQRNAIIRIGKLHVFAGEKIIHNSVKLHGYLAKKKKDIADVNGKQSPGELLFGASQVLPTKLVNNLEIV